MKKNTSFDKLSFQECSKQGCDVRIKENVIMRHKGVPRLCFPHYREQEANKGHDISTAREVRQGRKPARRYQETIAERTRREVGEAKKK